MNTLTLADHISLSDPAAHNRIVSALKRAFSRSPTVTDFLRKHRREEAWTKKDGSRAKKPKVFYRCAHCNQEFRSNQVQVDHIVSVVPLNIPSRHLSYNELINRLFCAESNLQILCKAHHAEKSKMENAIRDEWLVKLKYFVYETVNHVNQKRYIGVHKSYDYDDFYVGSGKLLKYAIKKHGIENFSRHILFVYDNAKDAFAKEHELVNSEIVYSEDYYNLAIGGSGNVSGTYADNRIKVICHQTGIVYNSINDAANAIDISATSISRALNNPAAPVKNLHFFTVDSYDEDVLVTFPAPGRPVFHFNSCATFVSLADAATTLNLVYRSLRNAMREPDEQGVSSLNEQYFIYADNYYANKLYSTAKRRVKLVELNTYFDSCIEAATAIKHKNPIMGSIAIGKAARTGVKMYGYHWEYANETIILQKGN
jgi:5-methylcytosine-specific restriction endonuclease McrA